MKRLVLSFLYGLWVKNFLRFIVGVKFGDSEFLIKEKQFLIVANHNSHLDTMTIMASMPSKLISNIRPVAASDYFGKNPFQAWMSNLFINTLLIDRKKAESAPEENPIFKMNLAISQGYSLILFPEGSRGIPEKMQDLKKGAAIILSENPHINYVPVWLSGMGKAMPKGDSIIVPHTAEIKFGKPTQITSLDVNQITEQIEKSLLNLKSSHPK